MIVEQNLDYSTNTRSILSTLNEEGEYIEKEDDDSSSISIELKFFGEKNVKNKRRNRNSNKNNMIVGKYKDIYIGGLSYEDVEQREKFGLNKYGKDIFYIGQWKNNLKEGIGFLKFAKSKLYLGEFSNNQINGFGILYYKSLENLYFGNFNEGTFSKGVYYNDSKGLFYHGGFIDNKKNDDLCSFFDIINQQIFIGTVKDDDFIKGFVSFCEINEEEENISNEENENSENNDKSTNIKTDFCAQKILYFDKEKNIYKHYYSFTNDFYIKIQDIYSKIFQVDYNIKDLHENFVAYFNNLENVIYNTSYLNNINRYKNDTTDESGNCIENNFIQNYEVYKDRINTSQEDLNLEDFKDIIMNGPEINPSFNDIELEE